MESTEEIKKREEKSTIISVKLSLEFLTAFEFELDHNPGTSIGEFYRKYLKYINWDQPEKRYPLINNGSLLAHLYGLIVYPKERLPNVQNPGKLLSDLPKNEWGDFELLNSPRTGVFAGMSQETWTLAFLLKKLRNAISHGNVEVNSSMDFTFSDQDGTIIKYKIENMIKFVYAAYGVYLDDWNFE